MLPERIALIAPVLTAGQTLTKISRAGDTCMIRREMLPQFTTLAELREARSLRSTVAV